ncbi:MAG: hypothetical protein AAF828_07345, partial [Bacteroidota bacterium]
VAELHPITEIPRETAPGFITESFVRILEKEITRDPTPWLWTHRRWKRGVPDEVASLMEEQDVVAGTYSRD